MRDSVVGRALTTILRGWWIVVALAVIAMGVAWFASGESETMYRAEVAMSIDNATLSRYPALPVPELLLAEVQGSAFKTEVLDEAGVDGGSLSFYTTGNPQTVFYSRYVSDSKEEAVEVAELAATMAIERYLEMSAAEIDTRAQTLNEIRLIKEQLKEAAGSEELSAYEQMDMAYRVHTLERQIIEGSALLQQQQTAYTVKGAASVSEIEATSSRMQSMLAAGLVGFIIGVAIALLRDRSWLTQDR